MVLLSLFLFSFSHAVIRQMPDSRQQSLFMQYTMWSVNKILNRVWPTVWESFITATYCKFVVWIGAPSLGWVVLCTYYWWLHGFVKWWLWTVLSIIWCTVSTRSAAWVLLAAIRICSQKNFDLELQLINASLIYTMIVRISRFTKSLSHVHMFT